MALCEIRFRDVALREEKERLTLRNRKAQLEKKVSDKLQLSQTEEEELKRLEKALGEIDADKDPQELVDKLFVALRFLMLDSDCDDHETLVSHREGRLVFSKLEREAAAKGSKLSRVSHPSDGAIVLAALTFGLMDIDAVQAPPVLVADKPTAAGFTVVPDRSDSRWHATSQAYYSALGEAKGMEDLARLVLPILADEGDPDGRGGKQPRVMCAEFARLMRELIRRGVTSDEIQLRRRVNEGLNRFQHIDEAGPYTRSFSQDGGINPPDLEAVDRYNLLPDNIRLCGVMIVAAMFDEIRAFQSLDYIVEANQRGDLVLGSSDVGRWLYNYWRDAPNRLSDLERRTFCAQTIGVPGGEPGNRRNAEFQPLMMHMCSNISKLINMYREAENPSYIFQQRARKSCRDLAANLSLNAYGMVYYATGELEKQMGFLIDVMGHPEIRANFAAKDMWQVIDQINTLHLPGGPKNTLKYQTLATCGTIITAWLADNARHIMSSTGQLLDMVEVRNPPPYPPGQKAITNPNDFDFVNACELWLSESGIPDTRTQEYAAMREAPAQPSRPVQMPSVVQDMLGDVGEFGIGLSRH